MRYKLLKKNCEEEMSAHDVHLRDISAGFRETFIWYEAKICCNITQLERNLDLRFSNDLMLNYNVMQKYIQLRNHSWNIQENTKPSQMNPKSLFSMLLSETKEMSDEAEN